MSRSAKLREQREPRPSAPGYYAAYDNEKYLINKLQLNPYEPIFYDLEHPYRLDNEFRYRDKEGKIIDNNPCDDNSHLKSSKVMNYCARISMTIRFFMHYSQNFTQRQSRTLPILVEGLQNLAKTFFEETKLKYFKHDVDEDYYKESEKGTAVWSLNEFKGENIENYLFFQIFQFLIIFCNFNKERFFQLYHKIFIDKSLLGEHEKDMRVRICNILNRFELCDLKNISDKMYDFSFQNSQELFYSETYKRPRI